MTAPFHKYRDMAVRAVDSVMAETLRLYPIAGGRADADRDQVEIEAPLRAGEAGDAKASSGGSGASWGSRIASGSAQAHISRAAYPGLVVRKNDKLRAMDREGQPFFIVASVNDRNHSRLILELDET